MLLAIDHALGQELQVRMDRIGPSRKRSHGTSQWIELGAEAVTSAIPNAEWLAGHIVEDPPNAGFHAGLLYDVTCHIVCVAYDYAPLRIAGLNHGVAHATTAALDIQFRTGREKQVLAGLRRIRPVVSQCQDGAPEGVE